MSQTNKVTVQSIIFQHTPPFCEKFRKIHLFLKENIYKFNLVALRTCLPLLVVGFVSLESQVL